MAGVNRRYIGTDDLVGAVVTVVGWDELTLVREGRVFHVSLEYESDYNSYCEGACSCCNGRSGSAYFRAQEEA
jgi:hypothetical protein